MKDASAALRKAVYMALAGNLALQFDGSGSPVSVYDGQVTTTSDNLYVIMGDERRNDRSNRTRFVGQCSILLEIIHRSDSAVDSRILDDISEQITEILLPTTTGVSGLIAQTGWQFVALQLESGNKLNMQISQTNTINRKLLTLSCRVVQLN